MKRLLSALVAGATGFLTLLLAFPFLSPPDVVTVGRNVFINPAQPLDANNSPTLLRNPIRAENLVMTNRIDRLGFSALLSSSIDNGATWKVMTLPLPPKLDRPFAPDIAFSPDGTLFVSYVDLEGHGNVPGNLWVANSKDGGQTLSDPVRVAGQLTFQVRLAADNDHRVHLIWLQAAQVGLLRLAGAPARIVSAHSTDEGQTWSAPVEVSDAGRERVAAATPTIDSEGHLVVLYEDFRGDRRDFENLDGPAAEEPFALVVARSEDGGTTFSAGQEVDSGLVPTRRFLVFLPEFPTMAVGRGGELYVAWSDGRNGDEDVFVRRSGDNGRTFGPPVRVNDNRTGDKTDQYVPRLAVAPDGRVDVLYLDRRNDPTKNVMTDAYLASSSDQGKVFTSVRMSSESFSSKVGPAVDDKIPVDFGSRLGLTSTDHTVVAAWTDARLGTEDTGRQDIAAAAAKVAPASPPRGRLLLVLVLLMTSLACLVGWFVTGRGAQGRSTAPRTKDESLL